MLEFQEGFFDQEVRDGFYLDTTMKTLWAAELEVLQKVAEICDRHGLKWYAAYGTLLGAIRHEGFVPWDDDMDIWVKRPDYNILMRVLPEELPEGYLVRSPMTDEGYDQYHTCLNSGNGISIAKERLEQFHGCPFTVGLDIFPLDYLPRNEKDRELQANLLAMTGRIAQLAKNVSRGDYDPKDMGEDQEESTENELKTAQKESIIEEINLGIEYLEDNCKLQIDHQLLEDEEWYKVSSELWKWANYLAMMYGENESDYLVEMFDYVRCSHKKYPKEWFEDGYSAAFESFMIPVPAGYHQILQFIYGLGGNYLVRVKKTGTHEYPYYARQLRQLRQYVKDIQQRAQNVGLVTIDQIEVLDESRDLLPEWIPLTMRTDGSPKKIVLSANDPAVYAAYGDRALDKLEETLYIFEQAKDSVVLWWRPQPVMEMILNQISPELGERYRKILNHYKSSGWGICDETDNIDRAVEACDVYYGEMNAIIQPFQNERKPVILSAPDNESAFRENADRINEYRAFLSFLDFAEDEKFIYFSNTNYNALVIADKATGKIVKHIPWKEDSSDTPYMHARCVQWQNQIYYLPAAAKYLHIYDRSSGEQKSYELPELSYKTAVLQGSWEYFCQNDRMYLLPLEGRQGLWCVTANSMEPSKEQWWDISSGEEFLRNGTIDNERFYSLEFHSNKLYITNVTEQTIECFLLPDDYIQHITYDGENFWYTSRGVSDIVCWNPKQGIVNRYSVPYDFYYIYGSFYKMRTYRDICFAKGHLFLLSGDGRILYVLNRETGTLQILHTIECGRGAFNADELLPHFKRKGDLLICMLQNAGEMVIINLNTLEVRQKRAIFHADSPTKEILYQNSYRLLLDRKALLFEEKGNVDLNLLLQYCMEG